MNSTFEKISLEIHGFQVCPVPTGLFALDGGAMFGTVPKVLWEKSNPPDELNRIPMEARALLLKSANRNILIDSGNGSDFVAKYGEKLGTKFATMYGVDVQGPSLLKSLAHFGLMPEDITDVILTHLHFDHAGGATCERNGKLVPTFPKAQYYLQKQNLATAQKPNLRERASYFPANFEPLLEHGCLRLLDGGVQNLLPGISVSVSNGHTLGQQLIHVTDDKSKLVYCGDLIPTSSHVRLAWIMGYDLNPLLMLEEKAALLGTMTGPNSYLYFEHDAYSALATVQPQGGGSDFAVKDRYLLEA